mmetsp:Transcript_1081/g.1556  ORF Transcript_1081/g.1556 Transcript_1081/m.1556 type:complete len:209 (+) Transcript_1081:141-767(+)
MPIKIPYTTYFSTFISHFSVEYLPQSPFIIRSMTGMGTSPPVTLCKIINIHIWNLNTTGECTTALFLVPPMPPKVKSTAASASSRRSPSYSRAIALTSSLFDDVLKSMFRHPAPLDTDPSTASIASARTDTLSNAALHPCPRLGHIPCPASPTKITPLSGWDSACDQMQTPPVFGTLSSSANSSASSDRDSGVQLAKSPDSADSYPRG